MIRVPAAAYNTGDEDDAALLRRHGAMVTRICRQVSSRLGGVISAEELWSAGAMGLLDAARKYDRSRQVRFETFAEHRVRGAVLDEVRERDHLPRRLRAETDRLAQTKNRLAQSLGRDATADELSAELGVDREHLANLEALEQPPVAWGPELHLVADQALADDVVGHAEALSRLTEAIAKLPPRLATLISLHYVDGLTYREVARALEVSEARVCQLHTEAVGKLREALAGEDGEGCARG